MRAHRSIGSPAIAVALGLALAFLAASCGGGSASSAKSPTPSASSSPTLGSPPPGGPVPAQLLGVWLLATPNPDPGLAVDGIINGKTQLTLTATTYRVESVNNNPAPRYPEAGATVVNGTEIDFFSETSGQPFCHLHLPDDVGRYVWTLKSGVLHVATVVATGYFGDPCGRLDLADQSYVRAK
jgi:hypothetical protein